MFLYQDVMLYIWCLSFFNVLFCFWRFLYNGSSGLFNSLFGWETLWGRHTGCVCVMKKRRMGGTDSCRSRPFFSLSLWRQGPFGEENSQENKRSKPRSTMMVFHQILRRLKSSLWCCHWETVLTHTTPWCASVCDSLSLSYGGGQERERTRQREVGKKNKWAREGKVWDADKKIRDWKKRQAVTSAKLTLKASHCHSVPNLFELK